MRTPFPHCATNYEWRRSKGYFFLDPVGRRLGHDGGLDVHRVSSSLTQLSPLHFRLSELRRINPFQIPGFALPCGLRSLPLTTKQ